MMSLRFGSESCLNWLCVVHDDLIPQLPFDTNVLLVGPFSFSFVYLWLWWMPPSTPLDYKSVLDTMFSLLTVWPNESSFNQAPSSSEGVREEKVQVLTLWHSKMCLNHSITSPCLESATCPRIHKMVFVCSYLLGPIRRHAHILKKKKKHHQTAHHQSCYQVTRHI